MVFGKAGGALAALALTLFLVSATNATSSPLLTTSLTAGSPVQTMFQGSPAVKVNYTDTLSGPMLVVVWLSVQNSHGQTAGVFVTTINFPSGGGEKLPAYVIVSGLAAGSYTANLFAVTLDGVPLSTTTMLTLTL